MKQVNRTINIYWSISNNQYANANKKVLVEPPRKLGTSISSVSKMLANSEEQKVLMPDIIGISPQSMEWNKVLTNYWNSFGIDIASQGKKLDIGFTYDITDISKSEYIKKINANLDKDKQLTTDSHLANYVSRLLKDVEDSFQVELAKTNKVKDDKSRVETIKRIYDAKFKKIIQIEGMHYKFGIPNNIDEYLTYRYCLVYGDVANEFALVSKSPKKIRFYLQSKEDIERINDTRQRLEENRMETFIKVIQDSNMVDNVLYALGKGDEILNVKPTTKHTLLNKISSDNPKKFINIVNDTNLTTKGQIEKFISNSILKRLDNSEMIVDTLDPSKIIGNNINGAITYFKNPDNKADITEYVSKYKGIINKN